MKQIRDSNVKSWLDDLKDVLYEADDLLDEVSAKAVTQKQVGNMLSLLFNVQDREIVSRLEDIVGRLESILKFKESLDLKEITIENLSYRTPSTSLQDSSRIYGRDKDKEAIIKLLLDDSSDAEEVSVIPIVGMGGVGKTTLAQLVYNDENLTHIFYFKAWVCVSDEFDILRVTKTITQAVTRRACEVNDLNLLHEDLHDKLKDKKFLIVLYDVWMKDYDNWNLLIKPFQRGIRGSKILVTTRNDRVASIAQTGQTYHLNQLSNEDCWLVFANHAGLSSISNENTIALEKVGREIVKKCKGLPLAAQSLGGILRRKDNIRDWNNILNNDIWELSENEIKVIPALRINYHYLPPHLKRCFVYCSLYWMKLLPKAVTRKEVSNMLSGLFKLHHRKMVRKLEDVVERLESMLKLRKSFDLKESAMENLSYSTPSTSLLHSPHIYGRDKDKEAIIKLLLD